jgi:hypothetical protein
VKLDQSEQDDDCDDGSFDDGKQKAGDSVKHAGEELPAEVGWCRVVGTLMPRFYQALEAMIHTREPF